MITTQIDAAIGTITLNHKAKHNVLSELLVRQVVGALAEFTRQEVRCVVLRAAPGVKVWSAGHDVSELPEGGLDPLSWRDPLRYLIREIENFPAPVIANTARCSVASMFTSKYTGTMFPPRSYPTKLPT